MIYDLSWSTKRISSISREALLVENDVIVRFRGNDEASDGSALIDFCWDWNWTIWTMKTDRWFWKVRIEEIEIRWNKNSFQSICRVFWSWEWSKWRTRIHSIFQIRKSDLSRPTTHRFYDSSLSPLLFKKKKGKKRKVETIRGSREITIRFKETGQNEYL